MINIAGFQVDLSNIQDFGAINAFEDGIYAATILDAKFDLNQQGNTALYIQLELASETFGTAQIKWQISSKAGFMLKPFWIAVNNFTPEEFAENPIADISDASRLVGAELLVQIKGEPSNKDPNIIYKNVSGPHFALPLHRYQELSDAGLIK